VREAKNQSQPYTWKGKKLMARPKLPPGNKRKLVTFKFHPSTVEALTYWTSNKIATKFVENLIRRALKLPPLKG
jgi:hypothetical protein